MSSSAAPSSAHADDPNLSLSLSGKVMLSGVIFFFFLFVSLLIFFLRANRYLGANPSHASPRPARFLLPVSSSSAAAAFPRRALDLAVLRSLPLTVFSSVGFKDGAECAVCLSELAEGDPARFLPGCLHGFHLACIDMWFGSHSTCPICRCSVELQTKNYLTALADSERVMPIRRDAEQGVAGGSDGEGSSSSKNCEAGLI